jgi:hypothetical protein
MRAFILLLISIIFNSCFLFSRLKKTNFSFSENGQDQVVNAVVPKKFNKAETEIDSLGNQVRYFFYPDGAVLYFASLKDTSTQIQAIDYDWNIPKELYHTVYVKGIDSTNRYWRETKFGNYKAGYKNVEGGDDGNFDSSINYFTLRPPH